MSVRQCVSVYAEDSLFDSKNVGVCAVCIQLFKV